MERSLATQTFLLFFFIFLVSLIGFAFFINNNKKLPEISLANAVETSILFVGFFTLFVFGASYYFVLSDTNPTTQPLKDSLSITASFFGGFATLVAAYIASLLFNDWRDQFRLELKSKYCKDILDSIFMLNQFTNSSYLFSQFIKTKTDFHQSLADKMSSDSQSMNVPLKNIQNLMSKIGNGIFTQDEVEKFNNYFGKIYHYQNLITIVTVKEFHDSENDFTEKLIKAYDDYVSQSAIVQSIVTKYHLLNIEHDKAFK